MGILISKNDFVGKYKLDKSINDNIDAYILEYEETILRNLLGNELFSLFLEDVDAETKKPESQIYLDIYNPLYFEENYTVYESNGMVKMLLGFIYFEYVRDIQVTVSTAGSKQLQSETAIAVEARHSVQRYNKSIDYYTAIQEYCYKNREVYPTFRGTYRDYTSSL